MTKAFRWLPFLLILGACATPPTGKYPDFKVAPTISVASTTVSTWTETPAEDHLLPNSQVFISGRGSTAGWLGPLGGLFGAMIGTAVDRSQNEAAVASVTAALTVKFHEAVTSALRNNVASAGSGVSPKIVEPDVPADVQLLPYARFRVLADKRAELSFYLVARFSDSDGNRTSKRYFYSVPSVRSVVGSSDGWADNEGKTFRRSADVALDRLTRVFLDDFTGRFNQALESANPRTVSWRHLEGDLVVRSLVLDEKPEYVVALPYFREQLARSFVCVVERGLIVNYK